MSFKMNRLPHRTVEDVEAGIEDTTEDDKKDKKVIKGIGIGKKLKARFPGFGKNLYEYFVEYLNYTSIQGLRYIGERERTTFERLWWLALFTVSLYFGLYLIVQSWIQWDTSPVLVSFSTSPTPVWKVPFPAVTICSETPVRQTVYNFTENFHRWEEEPANMTEEELKEFGDASLVCEPHIYQKGNLTTGDDTLEFLMKVAPDSAEMLLVCKYPLLNGTCHEFFTPILTEDGICYTFNMLDRSEIFRSNVYLPDDFMSHGTKSEGWTIGEGYLKNSPIKTYPRRAMAAGFTNRFVLVLVAYEQDLDYLCKGPVQGFKIILHNPAEIPRVGMHYFRAPLMQEVILAIKPDMIFTSDDLKKYNPRRRKCYFPHERPLAFYQSYTQGNCEVECLANYTRNKCGCVAFQMPREEKTPLCGSGNTKCIQEAQIEIIEKEIHWEISHEESQEEDHSRCDCLPGCTTLVYDAETSQADLSWELLAQAYKENTSELSGALLTRVNIFFKQHQFIAAERDELYGLTNFISNCGGILGLFTGFSFLSLVEICYFLTLRLLCNVKRYGRHYWSGSPDLLNNDSYDRKK